MRISIPRWVTCVGVNAFFGLLHPSLFDLRPAFPPLLQSLSVNAALFWLPAAGWSMAAPGARGLGLRLLRSVGISTAAFLACLVFVRVIGLTLDEGLAWTLLWVVANAGFAYAALRRRSPMRRSLLPREHLTGVLLFAASYAFFFWGATRVVPPQEDQDLEVLATGYGLLTRFEPLLLTDRHGVYFFAHPPLLHFYVGESFLLHGMLGDLAYFDEASRAVRDAREGRPVTPPVGPIRIVGQEESYRVTGVEGLDYILAPETGAPPRRIAIEDVELHRIYARYNARPQQQAARTPNLFFASATVALLGLWVGRLSRRWWLGVLTAVAYATIPEVFVRSSYGGYYAIGGFAALLMLLAAERWRRSGRGGPALLTGAFAALADHKLMVLPVALAIGQAIAWWREGSGRRVTALVHVTALGFGAGLAIFWFWGLAIAPAAFLQDHLHYHLLDRVTHVNPLGYEGYATPVGLWTEFAAHSAYVLLPAGLMLLLWDLWRARDERWHRSVPSRGSWLCWIMVTAIAFTVIDWRMTKHIILLVLPLLLGLVPDRDAPRWRVGLPIVVLASAIVFNVWQFGVLVRDFGAFVVTPAW